MANTAYTTCKICKQVKPFQELFRCRRCKTPNCLTHLKYQVALCPTCWDELVDEGKIVFRDNGKEIDINWEPPYGTIGD